MKHKSSAASQYPVPDIYMARIDPVGTDSAVPL